MTNEEQSALVIALIDKLRKEGSWCGETHVQKTCYVMQELLGVPSDFDFILYKHGPFSFGLQDEIGQLRVDELLTVVPTDFPYGSSLKATEDGGALIEEHKKLLSEHMNEIDFVARKLGSKRVNELERVATALFVTKELGTNEVRARAERIRHHKPHISIEKAIEAVEEIDRLQLESKELKTTVAGKC